MLPRVTSSSIKLLTYPSEHVFAATLAAYRGFKSTQIDDRSTEIDDKKTFSFCFLSKSPP